MKRRDLFRISAAMGLGVALPELAQARSQTAPGAPLTPPAQGRIPVAFLLSENAVVMDFAGPWEVFSNVCLPGREEHDVFELYTVAASKAPIVASGGMTILPNYTYADAPAPRIIVIPAQMARDAATLAWVRQAARTADLTMSVCTGAFLLAQTGLLDGKAAATHHGSFNEFAMAFPNVTLQRGARFVEAGNVASAGGISSGIDLALRVVERYFGRMAAKNTANNMEYQGLGWLDPQSNSAYAKRRVSTDRQPVCPICDMDVEKASASSAVYRKRTYYFCMESHKRMFEASPGSYV